jgi:pyruvate dehydrogenase E1 component alpha subunit
MAGTIAARAQAFGIAHILIESADPAEIRSVLAPSAARVRVGEPLVAEFVTHRVGPHSKGDDSRSAAELAKLEDWYVRYAALFPEQVARLDAHELIESVYADVAARPAVQWEHV